jgi:nucleoside phosphorylase
MNLFGLLRVVEKAKVPSIHIRVMSDGAKEGAGEEVQRFLNE